MKRRNFLGFLGGSAAVAATSPLPAFTSKVARDLVQKTAESGGFSIELVELVDGRKKIMSDMPIQRLEFKGVNFNRLEVGDKLDAERVSWDFNRVACVWGVHVFGGNVAGHNWNKFAEFPDHPQLINTWTLNVHYHIVIDDDILKYGKA